jgi:hypothetical protein
MNTSDAWPSQTGVAMSQTPASSSCDSSRQSIGEADEPYVPFRDVPKLPWMPTRRGGSTLAVETVHRWAVAGVRGHRLAFDSVGGVRCTKASWLRRFFADLAGRLGDGTASGTASRAVASRRRAEIAAAQLRKEGF